MFAFDLLRKRFGERGTSSAEFLVGASVGFVVAAAALTLTVGLLSSYAEDSLRAERSAAARWALDVMAEDIAQTGLGVANGRWPAMVDERIEFFERAALGVRSDFDATDDDAARDPEEEILRDAVEAAPTGNDEVVFFLRRRADGGGMRRILFEADLDSSDRVTREDGTLLARRDGSVEQVSAGPYLEADDRREGTLYRLHFTSNASRFATGRNRVSIPLLDHVVALAFEAFDAEEEPLEPCGGMDDEDARACRASIRGMSMRIEVAVPGGENLVFDRRVKIGEGSGR